MELLELLKAAKKHLATQFVEERYEGVTKYICFAVKEAYKAGSPYDVWEGYHEARGYVESRLSELQDSLGVTESGVFSESLATAYLESLGVECEKHKLQKHVISGLTH